MRMQDQSQASTRHSYKTNSIPSASKTLKAQTTLDSTSSLIGSSASRGSWYRKVAPRKPKPMVPVFSPTIANTNRPGSTIATFVQTSNSNSVSRSFNLISARESRQLFKINRSLTSSERTFIASAELLGIRAAKFFAESFHWEHQRPLRILQALRNGCSPERALQRDSQLFS